MIAGKGGAEKVFRPAFLFPNAAFRTVPLSGKTVAQDNLQHEASFSASRRIISAAPGAYDRAVPG